MVKANPTILKFYLAMMDSFSEHLSKKYSGSSLDNPDHYKTIILQKIVRMFHTLEQITKETHDEVSARCILRGILDSVTTYCFIYQRKDKDDMMFRHYLYILDGLTTYKKAIIDGLLEKGDDRINFENTYDWAIKQILSKLSSHPYYKINRNKTESLKVLANWKYESLNNTTKMKFHDMYKLIKLDDRLVNYYQDILSQYAHGLFLSNTANIHYGNLQKVLFDSIPLADRIVQGVCRTFPKDDLICSFLRSDACRGILNNPDFNSNDLLDFAKAFLKKDKTILV